MRNKSLYKNNKTGITGITPTSNGKKLKVYIRIDKKLIQLGRFTNMLDAARARWNAEVKHDFPNCNTTSSAYQYLQGNESRAKQSN
jgi:hypothetical protein